MWSQLCYRYQWSGSAYKRQGSGSAFPPTVTLTNRVGTSGVRCFGCGETDHHQANYKKQGKKALFIDIKDYEEEDAYVGEEPMFDGTDEGDEEVCEGDMGPTLVVRQICLTPRTNEDK